MENRLPYGLARQVQATAQTIGKNPLKALAHALGLACQVIGKK
jgi:hypothetical protein